MKKHREKKGLMAIKVDLKKAYDRIKWKFLDRALGTWGFSTDVRKLLASCVSTVNYSLLLNGGISVSFTPDKGIRQGDPLSLFLFILCFEFLTRLINREENSGKLHRIKVCKNAPAITHLMYANDILLTCRENLIEE